MLNRWPYYLTLLAICAAALAFRLPRLAARPMHNDEAVNTVKFNDLWKSGHFKYDPNEYHGPTLYYLTLPAARLSGAADFAATTEATYRIVPVVFGVGLILLLPLLADGIGRGGVLWAALFTAVSPAFVFYSRYYIHEMPLVFFALAAIACGWRYRRSGKLPWAVTCGAMVGLCYATKETWVIGLAAAAGSAVTAATIWRLILKPVHHGLHLRGRAFAAAAASFTAVFVLLFSGFFQDLRGPWQAILSYFHYAGRASGSVHDHPWYHYLRLLTWYRPAGARGPLWTEGLIVALAAFGFLLAVFRRHHPHPTTAAADHPAPATPAAPGHHPFAAFPPFVRFIGFYTLLLTIGFSVIPYKTPWCLLGFLSGMILLAGFAAAQLVHLMPHSTLKAATTLLLLAGVTHLAWQADRATNNFAARAPAQLGKFESSRYNPYVYAHTGNDIFTLSRRMAQIAEVAPAGHKVHVQVVTPDCWPVPFYLRAFPHVGYFATPADTNLTADVLIGSEDLLSRINADAAPRRYTPTSFGLRPGVVLWLCVEESLQDRLRTLWQSTPPKR
jgi:uncharacterized protein (TIGR03663 family)